MKVFQIILVLLLLVNCATNPIPQGITSPPQNEISLAEVMQTPDLFEGASIRWGGRVLKSYQEGAFWRVELMAYPLEENGRPTMELPSEGRFIAEFSEQKSWNRNDYVTIYGVVEGDVEYSLAQGKSQRLPRVRVVDHHKWFKQERSPGFWPHWLDIYWHSGGSGVIFHY